MRKQIFCAVIMAGLIGLGGYGLGGAMAQTPALLIPGVDPTKDVPGAKELPDPGIVYKIVFDLAEAAPKPGDINPGLVGVAHYVNTLGKYNIPADHRKIVVVFHRGSTPIVVNNETYKAAHDGADNPNIALIAAMKKAGVDFRVCGQSVLANKIDPKTINPDIELDLWAGMTITNLMMRGYAHLGGAL